MTKKANGEGSIGKYKDGWRGLISTGYDDKGKLKRKAFYGATKIQVINKMAEFRSNANKGIKPSETKDTFGFAFIEWIENYKKYEVAYGTYKNYLHVYNKHIKESRLSKIKIKDVKSKDLQLYYNNLKLAGTSSTRIRTINRMINTFLNHCIRLEYIYRNPLCAVVMPRIEEKRDIEMFTPDEQQRLIQGLSGYRNKLLIILALSTGLRLGELLPLCWDDINNNIVKVRKNYQLLEDGTHGITTLKNSSSYRDVPIPINVVKYIEKHKLQQQEEKNLAGELYTDNGYIFANEIGFLQSRKTYQFSYKVLLEKLNIPHKKFHALRHTYATRLFERGVKLKTASELLGHANIKITADTYIHVMPDEKIKAIEQINDIF